MATRIETQMAREDAGPQAESDPVAALLLSQLADPTVNKPEQPWAAAQLGPVTGGFRFRGKPGFRGLAFTFGVPPETGDEKLEAQYKKAFDRLWRDRRQDMIAEKKVAEHWGDRRVVFTPVPGKFECHLDLDVQYADVAAWLRKRPEFGITFYEEMAPMTVTLPGGQTINVVPQSDADRQALSAAATG